MTGRIKCRKRGIVAVVVVSTRSGQLAGAICVAVVVVVVGDC